jgi:hypothetical protein
MPSTLAARLLFLVAAAGAAVPAAAQHDPQAAQQAQREAMAALQFIDGTWRGPAWTLLPNGEKRHLVQTERIGPFLQGAVRVIEGRGYMDDGRVGFNALGIVSYDVARKAYSLRSYALGHAGDFAFRPSADGYAWEVPAGPNATIKYVATVRDGTFHEVGDRVVEGQPPLRIFEMTLKRLGDTAWPAGDAVPRN